MKQFATVWYIAQNSKYLIIDLKFDIRSANRKIWAGLILHISYVETNVKVIMQIKTHPIFMTFVYFLFSFSNNNHNF